MNKISKRSIILYILVIAFVVGASVVVVDLLSNSQKWAMMRVNKHIYKDNKLISAGSIYDRNGVILAETVDGIRKYNDDTDIRVSTLHTVGDLSGYIATGAHTAFKSDLTGYSITDGVYQLKKDGAGHDIHLTIDAKLCAHAYNALGTHRGTVGIYNYETGEILCMVSKPSFDINNKPKDIDTDDSGKYEGIYMNRFLSGVFTPGSTFKIVTAASAIENIGDIDSQKFKCIGKFHTSTGDVRCHSVHGTLNFEQALNRSCNSAFANIAEQLGNGNLTATAEQMGYNKRLTVDGIKVAKSQFTLENAVSVDRGWAGIGQYKDLANPCHVITMMGAIASNGSTAAPHILSMDDKGFGFGVPSTLKYLNVSTANKLQYMLRSNVKNYYGDKSFPGLEMCGKTGTAEVQNKKSHTWFVGFSIDRQNPLAVVVMLENSGGSGQRTAIPVANKVMQEAVKVN